MTVETLSPEFVSVVTTIRIRPECISAFKAALDPVLPISAKEAGMLRFVVMESPTEPGHFCFLDMFASQAAFDAHVLTPHVQEFSAKLGKLVISEPEIQVFTALNAHSKAGAPS